MGLGASMRRGRVSAAVSIVAAWVVCGVCVSAGRAGADDASADLWANGAWTNDNVARVILFSGGDIWRKGAFAHGGLLWSPQGLDSQGFTLKAVLSGGITVTTPATLAMSR